MLERIAARRAELDELEEQPATGLAEVRGEQDELAFTERVVERVSEQLASDAPRPRRRPGKWAGRL
ncbi:hypothetical protein [Streptomyces sp. NPDC002540]